MCGFAGYLSPVINNDGAAILRRMANAIFHRGPDDSGYWLDGEAGVGLSHRRLAVVDLSPAGRQPMVSASTRYVLVFNGEIYNHLDLRASLADTQSAEPHRWLGHSDTETLLAGFDAWGIERTIKECVGMFAFSVWDRKKRELTLARDRIGEKPLYYGWQARRGALAFIFGSELKALREHPSFSGEVNRDALCLFLRHSAVPSPYSIYKGLAKLPPGHLLKVSLEKREPKVWAYWDGASVIAENVARPFVGSASEAVDELERLLTNSVRQQMMADVPLGAFLSGGVDSSTVVALMQSQSNRPVKTYSIGFLQNEYNEAEYAKAVAQHLSTDHTELYITDEQAIQVIPNLPRMYDEPFGDASQIPTFLVSQLARQHVTVSLSGDAGDELFGGYERYRLADKLWKILVRVPMPIRQVFAKAIQAIPPASWSRFGKSLGWSNAGEKLHKGAGVLDSRTIDDLYRGIVSQWPQIDSIVIGGAGSRNLSGENMPELSGLVGIERMMALDLLTYLPDDILTKVDRAAMSVSLETRVPFLDHWVVEFAWRLPMKFKLSDGHTKWVLRQLLYRHVPKALIERPKMGFGVPLDSWLRGPLKDWAEGLLDAARLHREGYFHPGPIRKLWLEHLSGKRNWQYRLWNVLMFQAWNETSRN